MSSLESTDASKTSSQDSHSNTTSQDSTASSKIPILIISSHEPVYEVFKAITVSRADPRFEYYFLYADPEAENECTRTEIAPGCYDFTVKTAENVKSGCTLKTLVCMHYLKDRPWIVRTNLSSMINPDNLLTHLESLSTSELFVTGNVRGDAVFGCLMIWNNASLNEMLKYSFNEFPYNDDLMFSILSKHAGLRFDTSMTSKVVETAYSFFYSPPLPNNWIVEKRARNEFKTRLYSDTYSFKKYINICLDGHTYSKPYVVLDPNELCVQLMNAIRYMDITNEVRYIVENIKIMCSHNNHKHDGELLFFMMKYGLDEACILSVVESPEYVPDQNYSDLYFYCFVNQCISLDTYKKIGTTTNSWRG